jgi:hypothetical protein
MKRVMDLEFGVHKEENMLVLVVKLGEHVESLDLFMINGMGVF